MKILTVQNMTDQTSIIRNLHNIYCSLTKLAVPLSINRLYPWELFIAKGYTEVQKRKALKMDWATVAGLILTYGLPFAEALVAKAQSGGDVTPADLSQLKALANETPQTQILAAAARHGVDPSNPIVQQLLGLVPVPTPTAASAPANPT